MSLSIYLDGLLLLDVYTFKDIIFEIFSCMETPYKFEDSEISVSLCVITMYWPVVIYFLIRAARSSELCLSRAASISSNT